MRKVLYLFTLLCLLTVSARAAYTNVTHQTGTQTYAGVGVTIQNITVPPMNIPPTYFPAGHCGGGPYWIGPTSRNGYRYIFSQPVTHVKLQMTRIHDNDDVRIRVNGVAYNITAADLSPFAGTCGLPFDAAPNTSNNIYAPNTTQTGNADGSGAEINIALQVAPYVISSIEVEHLRPDMTANGVAYNFAFQDDTCQLPFEIMATDTTPCAGRCVTLNAPAFPNTTYSWSSILPIPAISNVDSASRRICNVTIAQTGYYIVSAIRGACTYIDSVYLTVATTPAAPTQVGSTNFPNGACRAGDVILSGNSTGAAGIQYYWFRKPSQQIKGNAGNPVNNQTITIPDFQVTDAGQYCLYAISGEGCTSDTTCTVQSILPDVVADFEITTETSGCVRDSILLRNKSTGATAGYIWRFTDNVGGGLQTRNDNTEFVNHSYPVPIPNGYNQPNPRTYVIELVALNASCRDSIVDTVRFYHPLKVGFTFNRDQVCQGYEGDTVVFTDTTTLPVNGPHTYRWTFGEPGSPTVSAEDVRFLYTLTGEWEAKLHVTDYLGCMDSATHIIFVDSTGPILFSTSDTVVCAGQQVQFTGDLNRVGLLASYWDFDNGLRIEDTANAVFNYEIPGTYRVSFNADYRVCRDTFAYQEIVVKPFPNINIGLDTVICPGGAPVWIYDHTNPENSPSIRRRWNVPTKDTSIGIWVRHPGVYSATVDLNGCKTTDSVAVLRNCYLDVPNAFTPDGDGNNDYFLPRQLVSRAVSKFSMSIFNRWGQKVFETTSLNGRGWDGKFNGELQPTGVYVYQVEVSFTNKQNDSEKYEGNVTLLR